MDLTEKEILLKDNIFDTFCKYHNVSASELKETYKMEFRNLNYQWCSKYRFKKATREFGLSEEIVDISDRVIKKTHLANNKDDFFAYLYSSLKNAEPAYYRKYERDLIEFKMEKRAKHKTMKNIINNNSPTSDEQSEETSKVLVGFEYIDLYKMTKINPFSTGEDHHDDSENDTLNKITPLLYPDIIPNSPLDEFIFKQEMEILREAVEFVMKRKQKRVKKFTLALFTLRCFKKIPNLEGISPILDKEILEACQTGTKIPRMYEIYMDSHPKASQKSSEVRSSEVLTDFLGEVKTFIEGKKTLNSPP